MGIDLQQLIKILNLTKSDSDGEALAAIRMANKMVGKVGSDWNNIVGEDTGDIDPIIRFKNKNPWKLAPDSADGPFLYTAAVNKDFLNYLNDKGKTIIYNISNDARREKSISNFRWEIFKQIWDKFANEKNK